MRGGARRLARLGGDLRRALRTRDERWFARAAFAAFALIALWVGWASWTRPDRQRVLDAIRMVESGGRDNCADGDGGLAIGPFQIHRRYWEDAVQAEPRLGPAAGFDYQSCRERAYAAAIVAAYMGRWVPEAWARGDAEVIARTHNGGPQGAQRESTLGYWQRVRAHLR